MRTLISFDESATEPRWVAVNDGVMGGRSQGGPEVIHAFGHGHLGVTLAPVTARIVASLIDGHAPGINIAPYNVSADRNADYATMAPLMATLDS